MDPETAAALVEESMRRASLIWVRRHTPGPLPARALWHSWVDGHAYVVVGGGEQPAPEGLDEPGAQAEVTVASKDTRSRLVVWVADVAVVPSEGEQWQAAARVLAARRLNSPDGEAAPQRWSKESTLLRLTPTGEVLETAAEPRDEGVLSG